jgi:predicted enzyme related to lactoylglutathione lyase
MKYGARRAADPVFSYNRLMTIDNAIASLAVKDLPAAVAWYRALLGRAADSTPMPNVAEWRFPRGGWLQIYQVAERAGRGSVTLAVSNIEEVVAHVATLGVDTSNRAFGAKAKTLMITDPDGNHIAFAETVDASMAR